MTFSGHLDDAPDSTDEPVTSTPTRVLLVDDDRIFARSLARALRSLGFTVHVSNDGREAIQLLNSRHFDAILLDLEMHPVDGWQVLEFHASLREPPAVVVLSGHLDVPRTVRALRAGVTDAYQKPIDPMELGQGLKNAIVKRSGDLSLAEPELDRTLDAASPIVGHAPALKVIRSQLRRVARYRDLPVLVVGEAGSEHDVVARAIHALDANEGPFEAVDCADATPPELERKIFGTAAGPSSDGEPGVLERAHGGTVFFDNISETSPALQTRLLRALETRRYRRVQSSEEHPLSARIVSATRRVIREGRIEGLRPDLFYRLAGITVALPPLRQRMEDIAPLVEHYVSRLNLPGRQPKRFSARALQALQAYDWPGNLKELQEVVEAAAQRASIERVGTREVRAVLADRLSVAPPGSSRRAPKASAAPSHSTFRPKRDSSLPTVERALILNTYEASQRNISEAARQLGIPRSTLRDRLRRLGKL